LSHGSQSKYTRKKAADFYSGVEASRVKLSEALSGHPRVEAERQQQGRTVRIHRGQRGYRLTRTIPDPGGGTVAQTWQFASLYELFVFARNQGWSEVDLEATDWRVLQE
jgi:hypothetical protein